jgi:hypothetical protein
MDLLKKIGQGSLIGAVSVGVMFAAGFAFELHKQKKPSPKPRVPIAEYNQVVRNYNAVVAELNGKIEDAFPDVPRMQAVLEQLEAEAFDAQFDGLMNEHW